MYKSRLGRQSASPNVVQAPIEHGVTNKAPAVTAHRAWNPFLPQQAIPPLQGQGCPYFRGTVRGKGRLAFTLAGPAQVSGDALQSNIGGHLVLAKVQNEVIPFLQVTLDGYPATHKIDRIDSGCGDNWKISSFRQGSKAKATGVLDPSAKRFKRCEQYPHHLSQL